MANCHASITVGEGPLPGFTVTCTEKATHNEVDYAVEKALDAFHTMQIALGRKDVRDEMLRKDGEIA
jgi:hypothetical protein